MTKKIYLTALILLFSSSIYAADVFIGVQKTANDKKTSLYISNFEYNSSDKKKADELYETIRSDLYSSRYFEIYEQTNAIKDSNSSDAKTKSQYYITVSFASEGPESWSFTGTAYNGQTKKAIFRKKFKGADKVLRRSAHLFSDTVIEQLTGNKGISHTRLAFANDSTGKKEIYIADYDGENVKKVTSDKSINLLPRWAADGNRIYYTTYRYGNPDMFEINFKDGKISPFSTYQGLNIPGNVSPDGLTMVMIASRGKDPRMYTLDIVTKTMKPLLENNYGITSSPTWSPDGKEVAFVSDRSGNPQIHIYNTETKKIRKLTKMNWCDSPMWSPDGSKIVFSGRETSKEKFNIFVSDLTGSNIVRLTVKNGNNENPVWSPDGRFIAFTSTRNKKKQIFIMDADGSAQHQLGSIPGNAYTPSWSN